MTISSTNRRAGPYSCNGVVTVFSFGFKVFADSDLLVVQTDTNGVESDLVLGVHFTATLNADQDANPGGTVTMLTVPLDGYLLTITSQLAYLQPTQLSNVGAFYPTVINQSLDRLTIFTQQLAEQISRAVLVNISSGVDPAALIDSLLTASASASASAAAAASSAAAAATAVPSGMLGYDPVDRAGDTMTGQLAVPSLVVNGSAPITTVGTAATKNTGTAAGQVPLVGMASATDTQAGLVELATNAEAIAGADTTRAVAPAGLAAAINAASSDFKPIAGTALDASTGAASYSFGSLPAGIKAVHVMLRRISTTSNGLPLIRFGTGGVPMTSGYIGEGSSYSAGIFNTTGVPIIAGSTGAASYLYSAHITFRRLTGNIWVYSGVATYSDSSVYVAPLVGHFDLSGELDLVQLTTAVADTFDGGLFNIQYET